jgi:hypothetical protein
MFCQQASKTMFGYDIVSHSVTKKILVQVECFALTSEKALLTWRSEYPSMMKWSMQLDIYMHKQSTPDSSRRHGWRLLMAGTIIYHAHAHTV